MTDRERLERAGFTRRHGRSLACPWDLNGRYFDLPTALAIQDTIEAAVAAEREACAALAEEHASTGRLSDSIDDDGVDLTAHCIAAAIRARGEGGSDE